MRSYTTITGDTWDSIAKKVYGDDHAFPELMDANPDYMDILIFDGGMALRIPELNIQDTAGEYGESDAAVWREEMI